MTTRRHNRVSNTVRLERTQIFDMILFAIKQLFSVRASDIEEELEPLACIDFVKLRNVKFSPRSRGLFLGQEIFGLHWSLYVKLA